MQLWCRGINNCLGLPVSQQWGQQERFSSSWHQLHSWCVLEMPAPGTSIGQGWLCACGLSSSTAGNEWPATSALLSSSAAPSPAFSWPRSWATSQGNAEVPGKLGMLAAWLPCHLIHLCFCPCFLPSIPQHSLWIHLSFPCSCIIQLSFSGSVLAPSFSPLSSPCSVCRSKTASPAIQPCEQWVMTEWKGEEGRQP